MMKNQLSFGIEKSAMLSIHWIFSPIFMTFLIDSIASNRFLIPILAKYSSSFSFYSNMFLTITKRECLWWKRCKFSFLLFWLLSISSRLSKVRKPPLLSALELNIDSFFVELQVFCFLFSNSSTSFAAICNL